jgi:hypothetical protein
LTKAEVAPPGNRQDPEIAWTVARIGGAGGSGVTAALAMITSKTGSSPPLAQRGRAGHDGRRRRVDAHRRRRGVQQGWDGRASPTKDEAQLADWVKQASQLPGWGRA